MSHPKCIFLFEVDVAAAGRCPMHRHACTEIVYTGRSSGWLHQGGPPIVYGPEQFIVYQPGPMHWVRTRSAGRHFCIGMSGCGVERLSPGVWSMPKSIVKWIDQLRETNGADDHVRRDLLCGLLALDLAKHQSTKRDEASPAVAAREMMDSRFDEIVGVQEVASSLFISPDYLRQLFRKQFGLSPLRYLIRKRIEIAQEMLRDDRSLSVAEVARRCGFENPYYFARMFKRVTGKTPSQYRDSG